MTAEVAVSAQLYATFWPCLVQLLYKAYEDTAYIKRFVGASGSQKWKDRSSAVAFVNQ
ncbi:hypothetical protein HMPREF2531_05634 [Bacteroides intestinalis]|uniref:Uncharacterized protein n=1 Tax=Bacteroides intestinalis TaxID=329854 RepID=A0A139KM73_9BACE|nr:hypothetical protein HMPREF2531_05634 [Bacteroides intestinalis]